MDYLSCLSFDGIGNEVGNRSSYDGDFVSVEVEGVRELETLCPVSKLTGFPKSMQSVIFMITDKNSRLADMLFPVLEEIKTSDMVSDADKFKLLMSRLDTGSFFENDRAAEVLGKVVREFMPDVSTEQVGKVVEGAQQKINFESGDVPVGDS